MIEEIENIEEGIIVNFKKQTIIDHNDIETKFGPENIDIIRRCINISIDGCQEHLNRLQEKINQKDTFHVPIHNGYKISEPLNDMQRVKFVEKVEVLEIELMELNSLKGDY